MCYGDQVVECYAGKQRIGAIGLHHGVSIRWSAWGDDAQLADGSLLLRWLDDHGVSEPLRGFLAGQEAAARAREEVSQWVTAVPQELADVFHEWLNSGFLPPDLDAILKERLAAAYPDLEHRALLLLRWFATGSGLCSSYPSYEDIPGRLLLELPSAEVISAVEGHIGEPQVLSGAVRYFAGFAFRPERSDDLRLIPAGLRRRLLVFAEQTADEDKLTRARKAFV